MFIEQLFSLYSSSSSGSGGDAAAWKPKAHRAKTGAWGSQITSQHRTSPEHQTKAKPVWLGEMGGLCKVKVL